jgi:dTDP-4-dehydrorhamnose 3,5-epimerase
MAELKPLDIEGAWLFISPVHNDPRGYFREWFKLPDVQHVVGRTFPIAQANLSRSKRGAVRGIHFSLAPEGQAKWVTCVEGAIWDVIIDIRPESRTFKRWVGQELKSGDGKALMISEGLGHAFLALEDESVISYLLTTPYSPQHEFAINPTDREIGIDWPLKEIFFSDKDKEAPTLAEFLSRS